MTVSDPSRPRFDMGRVIQRALGALGRNLPVFASLAILLSGIPQFATGWARLAAASNSSMDVAPFVGPIGGLFAFVGALMLQGGLTRGTIVDLNGGRATFGDCLGRGAGNVLQLFLIGILMAIGLFLGFLLVIAPGLILLTMWSVVVPSQVAERRGVFESFSRSAELTKGHRWSIFGLMVVYFIVWIVVMFVVGMVVALVPGLTARGPVVELALGPIVSVIQALVGAAGAASIYYELRQIKEGVGPAQLAAVFD